jgi:hypothetical protein
LRFCAFRRNAAPKSQFRDLETDSVATVAGHGVPFSLGSSNGPYLHGNRWGPIMRLIHLAFILLPVPVMAGQLPDNDLVRAMLQDERAPAPTESFLHNPLSLGSVSLDPGSTRLADVASALNVVMVDEGKGNFVWSCATAHDETLWLISEAADVEGEPLVNAVIRTAGTSEQRCAATDIEVSAQFPGLDARLEDIEAVLGSTQEMGGDIIGYRTRDTLGDDGGYWEVISTLSYHMVDGVADAVGYDVVIVR